MVSGRGALPLANELTKEVWLAGWGMLGLACGVGRMVEMVASDLEIVPESVWGQVGWNVGASEYSL